eukprot:bmy_05434T0
MGLFLPCGAGMRGTCCVCTSSLSEGKAGRGLGFELEEGCLRRKQVFCNKNDPLRHTKAGQKSHEDQPDGSRSPDSTQTVELARLPSTVSEPDQGIRHSHGLIITRGLSHRASLKKSGGFLPFCISVQEVRRQPVQPKKGRCLGQPSNCWGVQQWGRTTPHLARAGAPSQIAVL